ncbi:MAG: MBL fold metallo-hydrolase [Pelagibacteraceae bacterium]|nr:MBL fold metallo-hydrolase [Pelagibacteraceae bacterium]
MTKLIILGCGSSVGSPWITNNWGKCDRKNKFNIRTRCSAFIQKGDLSILIDSSPDIKKQILDNKIKNIDYVLYTHEHSDQTSGIFELRPFFWKNKKKVDIYASSKTLRVLKKKYDYCFFGGQGYAPIIKGNLISKKFTLSKKKNKILFTSFEVEHGKTTSTVYLFDRTAYISDCSQISGESFKKLRGLKLLILDCLKISPHPTHFNLEQAILTSELIGAKRTILTNLHTDLDYNFLKKNLPKNIIPAHDQMILKI